MFSTSRRNLLLSLGAGLGPVALSNLLQAEDARSSPLALQPPMFAPRAKRVIMLVMEGGPGHMDTFDHYSPNICLYFTKTSDNVFSI